MKIAVSQKITVTVAGNEVELSIDELRQLRDSIDTILAKPKLPDYLDLIDRMTERQRTQPILPVPWRDGVYFGDRMSPVYSSAPEDLCGPKVTLVRRTSGYAQRVNPEVACS